ncbi:MAG: GNAT family N-acetyltransferase [Candidatus Thiosymbion ectosymbiont of Robbea hypermnestra]|nr:GNAT family N-acetyltransferase [Candidatus Thiosymbion ectosymbiont of Robbea hypermnestra]
MVFGFSVARIDRLTVLDESAAARDYDGFRRWRDEKAIGLVSCRLPQEQLSESMFLESKGFGFIETVLYPELDRLQALAFPADGFVIAPALRCDLAALREIAERSFRHGRYHVDPRLDSGLADARYGRWVANSLDHPRQRLLKVVMDTRIIGFFIVESMGDKGVYWHLGAIDPAWQGRGYGERVWRALLRYCRDAGRDGVVTSIPARNVAILNLYAKLGFRFRRPEATFHWLREGR